MTMTMIMIIAAPLRAIDKKEVLSEVTQKTKNVERTFDDFDFNISGSVGTSSISDYVIKSVQTNEAFLGRIYETTIMLDTHRSVLSGTNNEKSNTFGSTRLCYLGFCEADDSEVLLFHGIRVIFQHTMSGIYNKNLFANK